MEISRVGTFTLGWGESVVWDDRRDRLVFVDCATQRIHWLEGGDGELQTFQPPSMPCGMVPTDDGRWIAVLDDGLHVVDLDAGSHELLAPYPEGLGSRANDAVADLDGNLITGTLNVEPAPGSTWQYSSAGEWTLLDDDIANTNGPAVALLQGVMTLIVGDTSKEYFAYDYDPDAGTVGERRVFGATAELDGLPDGSTFDDGDGLWCALVGGGQLARFTVDGLDRQLPLPVANPTDVTFGGPNLDRLYVMSIAGDDSPDAGGLLVVDGLGYRGRPEPRFHLA